MGPEAQDNAGEALFRAADSALYGAKSRGRNQVFVAPDSASPYAIAARAKPGA
jgi:predicted signal transduction protein with EAL and GGDEF domain